ncbi:MAG: hypothetical protein IJ094_01115 [Bacilli bacterium]|nr:hypothetical protein [Bacilli bacterium]
MEKVNDFNAKMIDNINDYYDLSMKMNIPVSEIIQIDLNRCGIYLPNNEVRENFRVRFKGQIYGDYVTWYALPVRNEKNTNFSASDNHIFFKNQIIGDLSSTLMLDTCENSYQRGPNLLNLNSRSRSNCGGCKACIHNYKNFYDNTVIKDQKGLYSKEDIANFFDNKKIDVSQLVQIAVVTGLFHGEMEAVNHMELINEVAKKRGFNGELMYFGCEINSREALSLLSKISNFSLIYAYDNFTKRKDILTKSKSILKIDDVLNTLNCAKSLGINTNISYIAGIDSLKAMEEGFRLIKDSITKFPIINIYQTQNMQQVNAMDEDACYLEYYLNARKMIEQILKDKCFKPKRWENYRPLWYKYYNGVAMPDNSFGQEEKILKKSKF